jgi:hypothetical protein
MKKIILLLAIVGAFAFQGCAGPEGPQGDTGVTVEAEVFELRNVNFSYSPSEGYTIYQTLSPQIYASDALLIYRLSGTINSTTPIWQLIPRTLYLTQGELDYDFDFSKVDFTIYAGGTYNLALTPSYIQNQTFRIVIIPGYFSNKSKIVDFADYDAVMKLFSSQKTTIKVLN